MVTFYNTIINSNQHNGYLIEEADMRTSAVLSSLSPSDDNIDAWRNNRRGDSLQDGQRVDSETPAKGHT